MERNFIQEIGHRLARPWNSAFLGYFILIVIIFAGFGVGFSFHSAWNSPVDDGVLVAQNLSTYAMAILATAVIDLNISWEIQNRVSFFLYSILIFVIGLSFLFWTYSVQSDFAFIPAILISVIAWIVWILANAYNERLSDQNFFNAMRGKGRHGDNWEEATN